MVIKKLILKNFRNYKNQEFDFYNGMNIISGPNGSGKTNILESIYICGLSKTFRNTADKNLLNFYNKFYFINLLYTDDFIEHNIKLSFTEAAGKQIILDNKNLKNFSSLIGKLKLILFYPDDINIIKGAPEFRRRFIDIYLSQIDIEHFVNLNKYRYYLKNRNLYLKANRCKEKLFFLYDKKFRELAVKIIFNRKNFINQLNKILNDSFNNEFVIKLVYNNFENAVDKNEIEYLFDELSRNKEKQEAKMGYSCVGPHIDDISIFLNKKEAKIFASQGEQKLASILLKLSLNEYYRKVFKINPILLLDDILSELDSIRRKYLFDILVKDSQIILTTTDKINIEGNYIFTK